MFYLAMFDSIILSYLIKSSQVKLLLELILKRLIMNIYVTDFKNHKVAVQSSM